MARPSARVHRCNNISSAHWTDVGGGYVGANLHDCDARGLPLLGCGRGCADAYAQLDVTGFRDVPCVYPQITHLRGLLSGYPNATFFLPRRPAAAWARSALGVRAMARRLAGCPLGTVSPPPFSSNASLEAARLEAFYDTVMARARSIIVATAARGELRWVEFDVTEANASAIVAAAVPGSDPGGWGRANAARPPTREVAARDANFSS